MVSDPGKKSSPWDLEKISPSDMDNALPLDMGKVSRLDIKHRSPLDTVNGQYPGGTQAGGSVPAVQLCTPDV